MILLHVLFLGHIQQCEHGNESLDEGLVVELTHLRSKLVGDILPVKVGVRRFTAKSAVGVRGDQLEMVQGDELKERLLALFLPPES